MTPNDKETTTDQEPEHDQLAEQSTLEESSDLLLRKNTTDHIIKKNEEMDPSRIRS